MILALRTDRPEAEINLFDPRADGIVSAYSWLADRTLAQTLLQEIHQQLKEQSLDWSDLTGIAVYTGPGSFTGLRIGVTVANVLAYSLDIPIAGATGDTWLTEAADSIWTGANDRVVIPAYGGEAHITPPRK